MLQKSKISHPEIRYIDFTLKYIEFKRETSYRHTNLQLKIIWCYFNIDYRLSTF